MKGIPSSLRVLAIAGLTLSCAAVTPPTPSEDRPGPSATNAPRPTDTLFAQALAAYDAGDEARATALFQELVATAPEQPAPHNNLGVLYHRAGRVEDAIREYESTIRLDPGDATAYYNLGLAHRRRGALGDAERAYLGALEHNPGQAEAHYNLGILYDLYLNRPDQALVHYRAALDLGVPDAEAVAGWIRSLERRSAAPLSQVTTR